MAFEQYDVMVLGCGPAGAQAAIHAARRKRRVLVLGRTGRSNVLKAHVENLWGVKTLDGATLLRTGCLQATGFGATLVEEDVTRLSRDEGTGLFVATLESRRQARARALVIATGVSMAKLNVPGEKEFVGRGVSYCVDCDANFFKGKRVVVIGDGSAAAEGALSLLAYAGEVHLVATTLDVQAELARAVESSAIVRHVPAKVSKIAGGASVTGVEFEGGQALTVDGVFIELGAKGVMELTMELGVELDPENFSHIVTDSSGRTNVPGVFAAGDVTGRPWQIAKAVGEGCVAGLAAAEYVKGLAGA